MIIGSILTFALVITNIHMYILAEGEDELKSAELLIQEKFDKTESEAHEAVLLMQNNNMTDEEILNWSQTMQEGTTEQYAEAAREKMQEQQLNEKEEDDIQLRANPFSLGEKGDIIIDAREGSNSSSNSYWSVGHTAR